MIPTNHRTEIIGTGIRFMRVITESYGPEEGMKLWDRIASVLDPDIKGEIFFAMITGEYNDRICISGFQPHNKVSVIKAFRQFDRRRLGLKEAKDLADLCASGKSIELEVDPMTRIQIEKELLSIGCQLV